MGAVFVVVGLVAVAACSSGDRRSAAHRPSASSTTRRPAARPAGPAADLSAEITGSQPPFLGSATPTDLAKAGYVEHEYVTAGTATSYAAPGGLTADGRWSFTPAGTAPYRTRVVVRRPAKAADFSGTVVVEWLNVSGGLDADPDWASLHEELTRSGDAWVGLSAQRIGVEGGPVLVGVPGVGADLVGKGLKAIDPERYGTLSHPGDGFAFDMYTQVARAVRAGAGLGPLKPSTVLAAGESQSAFALVTYVNGVQPLTHAFDGFFVHSRGAVGLPLVGPGKYADIAGSIGGTPVIFRTDQDVPIMDVQSESDVAGILSSYAARQPDSDSFRLWEVAGTAHADRHLMGSIADQLDCGVPVNDGPLHVVAKAAMHALVAWVRNGTLPPRAPRIGVTGAPTSDVVRDPDGIARGGIRTPPVAVPVVVLSGKPGPNPATICLLLGSTTPLPAERLAAWYPSRAAYTRRYRAATDATIAGGFALAADRAALMAYSDPTRVSG
ncbi:MAG: alpha/beta hydrolase domain-containing protein [Acidimicrobiia bacterium]